MDFFSENIDNGLIPANESNREKIKRKNVNLMLMLSFDDIHHISIRTMVQQYFNDKYGESFLNYARTDSFIYAFFIPNDLLGHPLKIQYFNKDFGIRILQSIYLT